MAKTKITLEDNGQDLLWLLCDEYGTVVNAGPFQSTIWSDATIPIWDNKLVRVGEPCPIHTGMIMQGYLKHKIEKIEIIEN